MNNFKDFWNSVNLPEQAFNRSSTPSDLSAARSSLSLGTVESVDTRESVFEFSSEISDYVTSDEIIFELSENIGELKTNETEEEFLERASQLLREALNKKFNV